MASLYLPKFPTVGSSVVCQNFGSAHFELNLVLMLALPNFVELQRWSDRQLDENDLGQRFMKILIIFRPDPLESCLLQFHNAEPYG